MSPVRKEKKKKRALDQKSTFPRRNKKRRALVLFIWFDLISAGFFSILISLQVDATICWRGRTADRVTCTETCRRHVCVFFSFFFFSFLVWDCKVQVCVNGGRVAFQFIYARVFLPWGTGLKWNGTVPSLPGVNFEAGERTLWEEAILCDDHREERRRRARRKKKMLAAAVARWAPPVLVLIGDGWCWSFQASLPGILWEFPSRTKSKGFNASQEWLQKHPAALWLHLIWLPSCSHAAKVTLWTRRTFCLSSLLLFLHRENLCCSSSCQEQVFTWQPVTRAVPGGKRRSAEAFASSCASPCVFDWNGVNVTNF